LTDVDDGDTDRWTVRETEAENDVALGQ